MLIYLQPIILTTMFIMVGVYFIFSNTIMAVLRKQESLVGAAVMASINDVILNPVFKLIFLASGIGALVLSGVLWSMSLQASLACGVFFVGTTLVTVLFNIPLNNALKTAVESQQAIVPMWERYLREWVRWNHVRTLSAILSCLLWVTSGI